MRASKEEKCAKKAREYIGNRLGLVEGKVYTLISGSRRKEVKDTLSSRNGCTF